MHGHSLEPRPLPFPQHCMDVLHLQHAEGRVLQLLQGFRILLKNLHRANGVRDVMCLSNYGQQEREIAVDMAIYSYEINSHVINSF